MKMLNNEKDFTYLYCTRPTPAAKEFLVFKFDVNKPYVHRMHFQVYMPYVKEDLDDEEKELLSKHEFELSKTEYYILYNGKKYSIDGFIELQKAYNND